MRHNDILSLMNAMCPTNLRYFSTRAMKQAINHLAALLLLFLLPPLNAMSQSFTVMSYNCENAFDTIPDAVYDDSEYLPDGNRHWTRWRMYQKLRAIGKVIMAVDTEKPADIVCLEEVESDSVLTWLIRQTPLAQIGYEYVMTNSADSRGIDVALIYSPLTFRLLENHSIRVNTSMPTRDVLYVNGIAGGRDTLDLYVVHLPSRLNGKAADRNRHAVAEAVNHSIDSISLLRPNTSVMILGDFNEGTESSIIQKDFAAMTDVLVNYRSLHRKDLVQGSYKYRGNWETIDHILVSPHLLPRIKECGIYANPMLLEDDMQYGGVKPRRTYSGWKYNGGFSDHLPVFMKFE